MIIVLVLVGIFRNLLIAKQFGDDGNGQVIIKGIVIVAFMIFSAALIPVCLKLFLILQIRIGNGDLGLIKLMQQHAMKLVYAAWAFIGFSIAIALPVMIKDGFFSNP